MAPSDGTGPFDIPGHTFSKDNKPPLPIRSPSAKHESVRFRLQRDTRATANRKSLPHPASQVSSPKSVPPKGSLAQTSSPLRKDTISKDKLHKRRSLPNLRVQTLAKPVSPATARSAARRREKRLDLTDQFAPPPPEEVPQLPGVQQRQPGSVRFLENPVSAADTVRSTVTRQDQMTRTMPSNATEGISASKPGSSPPQNQKAENDTENTQNDLGKPKNERTKVKKENSLLLSQPSNKVESENDSESDSPPGPQTKKCSKTTTIANLARECARKTEVIEHLRWTLEDVKEERDDLRNPDHIALMLEIDHDLRDTVFDARDHRLQCQELLLYHQKVSRKEKELDRLREEFFLEKEHLTTIAKTSQTQREKMKMAYEALGLKLVSSVRYLDDAIRKSVGRGSWVPAFHIMDGENVPDAFDKAFTAIQLHCAFLCKHRVATREESLSFESGTQLSRDQKQWQSAACVLDSVRSSNLPTAESIFKQDKSLQNNLAISNGAFRVGSGTQFEALSRMMSKPSETHRNSLTNGTGDNSMGNKSPKMELNLKDEVAELYCQPRESLLTRQTWADDQESAQAAIANSCWGVYIEHNQYPRPKMDWNKWFTSLRSKHSQQNEEVQKRLQEREKKLTTMSAEIIADGNKKVGSGTVNHCWVQADPSSKTPSFEGYSLDAPESTQPQPAESATKYLERDYYHRVAEKGPPPGYAFVVDTYEDNDPAKEAVKRSPVAYETMDMSSFCDWGCSEAHIPDAKKYWGFPVSDTLVGECEGRLQKKSSNSGELKRSVEAHKKGEQSNGVSASSKARDTAKKVSCSTDRSNQGSSSKSSGHAFHGSGLWGRNGGQTSSSEAGFGKASDSESTAFHWQYSEAATAANEQTTPLVIARPRQPGQSRPEFAVFGSGKVNEDGYHRSAIGKTNEKAEHRKKGPPEQMGNFWYSSLFPSEQDEKTEGQNDQTTMPQTRFGARSGEIAPAEKSADQLFKEIMNTPLPKQSKKKGKLSSAVPTRAEEEKALKDDDGSRAEGSMYKLLMELPNTKDANKPQPSQRSKRHRYLGKFKVPSNMPQCEHMRENRYQATVETESETNGDVYSPGQTNGLNGMQRNSDKNGEGQGSSNMFNLHRARASNSLRETEHSQTRIDDGEDSEGSSSSSSSSCWIVDDSSGSERGAHSVGPTSSTSRPGFASPSLNDSSH